MKKEIEILNYCKRHTQFMWAASICGIILDIDFRDVTREKIEAYIEEKKNESAI